MFNNPFPIKNKDVVIVIAEEGKDKNTAARHHTKAWKKIIIDEALNPVESKTIKTGGGFQSYILCDRKNDNDKEQKREEIVIDITPKSTPQKRLN